MLFYLFFRWKFIFIFFYNFRQNKQKFYGGLTTISHQVGSSGFSAKDAQPVFKIALGPKCKPNWTSGLLDNITEWADVSANDPGLFPC